MLARLLFVVAVVAGLGSGHHARGAILSFDFSQGQHDFAPGFADYVTYDPLYYDEMYEMAAGWKPLPPALGTRPALFISGTNPGDGLFMYFKRQVSGLQPNAAYQIDFRIDIATEVSSDPLEIGNVLKAGGSPLQPANLMISNGAFRVHRINWDKGRRFNPGAEALVLGGIPAAPGGPFQIATLSSAEPLLVSTDPWGSLWLFFGTDSVLEGSSDLYYTGFQATLTPIPEPHSLLLALTGGLMLAWWLARRARTP